jgi:hypothetical protein
MDSGRQKVRREACAAVGEIQCVRVQELLRSTYQIAFADISSAVVAQVNDQVVRALGLEAVDTVKQVVLPSVVVLRRERAQHHDTDRSVRQHGVIGDVVASSGIVSARHVRLRQVDCFTTCVQVGQGSHGVSALVHTGRFQQSRRSVSAIRDVGRNDFRLVVDTVGSIGRSAVCGPV